MNNHIPNNNLLCKVLLSFVMLLMLGGKAAAQNDNREAYVVVSTDSTTLTFYYDDQRSNRIGAGVHGIDENNYGYPKWINVVFDENGHNTDIENPYTSVVFDASFKDAKPTSCFGWFNYCTKLTEIKGIENLHTVNVTDMREMFYGCSSLTTIDVRNFNTANVTSMGFMFQDCSSLTTLDVSKFNTENVTYMRGMFYGCSSLTTLDVSNFNTANLTEMHSMFGHCDKLTTILVSEDNWNTDKASNPSNNNWYQVPFESSPNLIGNAGTKFSYDHTDIDYAHIDVDGNPGYLTKDSYKVFYDLDGDGKIDDLSTVDWENDATPPTSFALTNTSELPIPNPINKKGLKFKGWYGTPITGLTEDNPQTNISIPAGAVGNRIYTAVWEELIEKEAYTVFSDGTLTFYYDGNKPEGAYDINDNYYPESFSFPDVEWNTIAPYVSKVVFDDSFAEYYPKTCDCWFNGMSNLTEIVGMKDNLKTDEVIEMNRMFGGCSSLTTIDISKFNTEKVVRMIEMFDWCSSLTTLDISNFNTGLVREMAGMFAECENLQTIFVSDSWSNSSVNYGEGMFDGCNNLRGGQCSAYSELGYSGAGYARIDGGESAPGYFTRVGEPGCTKHNEAYAVFSDGTLTFFYDENKPENAYPFGNVPELKSEITKVVFDESFADYRPTNLNSLFSDYQNLTTIVDMEKYLNTTDVTDMTCMFFSCFNLESLNLSNFKTQKVESMNGMFIWCWKLKELDLSSFNTINVSNMLKMFMGAGIETLNISSFNTENTIEMFDMFGGCSSLRTIYVGDSWTTSAISKGGVIGRWSMFADCTSLYGGKCTAYNDDFIDDTYARIDGGESAPGYFTRVGEPGCTNRNEAYVVVSTDSTTLYFYYDDQRKAREGVEGWTHGIEDKNDFGYLAWIMVDDPNYYPPYETIIFDTSFKDARPTSCATWFYCCINLTNIIGIENLHTDEVTEMQFMFFKCASLQNLDVSNFNTENVTDMGWMFNGCSSLTTLDVSNFNTENVTDMESMFGGCSSLTTLDVSNFNTENVTDMGWMFYGCSSLTTLDVSNFNTENVTDMSYMFYDGRKLQSLDLSSFNTENVENMHMMFRNIYHISTLDLHNFNTSKVTDMGHMFCESNFVELDLSNFNTEKVKDMSYMFGDCSYLKNINLSSFDTKNVENMEQMFCKCEQLEKLDLSNFNTENVTNMRGMFGAFWYEDGTRYGNGCNSLVSLDLSSFNTAKVTDMRSMFAYCSNLTAIVVDKNKWSTQSVSKTFDDVYGYKTPFEGSPNLIGNAGTLYDEKHTDIDYAHIDEGESNPGYLTTESYKVFYNLDGGDWNGVDYPKSFAIDLKENIQIPTPKKKGYRFLGWTGTLASGITGNTPIKNVAITPDKPGNRIYTAHWEEENLDKTITFPSTPKEPEAFCNGDEKKVVLRYDTQVVYDVAKYKISLDDIITNEEEITEQNGEYQIDIPIPENTEPGTYSGKIEFYNANNAKTAEYPVKIQVAAAKNIILNLYEDVIFADNHSGLYAADGWQWYKNGEPIKNANRQYYFERPFKQGSYMVEMKTIKDGTTVYSCPIVVTHDILKNAKSPVTSYPNPAVGGKDVNLYIVDYNCETDYTIILSNTQGVIVRTINNAAETSTLSLPQGIYSGALISNGSKKGFKLIVK